MDSFSIRFTCYSPTSSVLDKIIAEFRGLATEGYQFYLNHDILLQVILQHVPERHKSTVASKMSEVDKTCTAREARQAISNLKLPKHVLDEIEGSMITGGNLLYFDDIPLLMQPS